MIYSVSGKLAVKNDRVAVVETAAGIGFMLNISPKTCAGLPNVGESVKLFCATTVTREGIDLYGFVSEAELELFYMFTSVNGIGPKGALKIMGVGDYKEIMAAIYEGRADLLEKAGSVGSKKASRIILEMRDKIKNIENSDIVGLMEANHHIIEALQTMGFRKKSIEEAVKKLPPSVVKKEERLKETLKILSQK